MCKRLVLKDMFSWSQGRIACYGDLYSAPDQNSWQLGRTVSAYNGNITQAVLQDHMRLQETPTLKQEEHVSVRDSNGFLPPEISHLDLVRLYFVLRVCLIALHGEWTCLI